MTPVSVRFWGVRGSIPSPGQETVRYGGNTSCVELRCDGRIFILDSGTGIRRLGISLLKEFAGRPIEASLFVGHSHWDHIQGFPFFTPAYIPKNRFRVHSAKSVGDSFENILKGQMGQNYFPVEVADMQSQLEFIHVENEFDVDGVRVKTIFTNHPGVNIAYRFEFDAGRSVVYLTDHENHQAFSGTSRLTMREDKAIEDFCRGAALVVCDSQYNDEEYKIKRGWGHSRWKDCVQLGINAEIKNLALYHHEPVRSDDEIDAVVKSAEELMRSKGGATRIFAAAEGKDFEVA